MVYFCKITYNTLNYITIKVLLTLNNIRVIFNSLYFRSERGGIMYYKIFEKNSNLYAKKFDETSDSYIHFIKSFTSEGYNQFIITTDIMIDLIDNTIKNKGIFKDIYYDKKLYDIQTIKLLDALPLNIERERIQNIKMIFEKNFINSIEIEGIKIKFKKQYFIIRANGVISSEPSDTEEENIEIIESLFENI